MVDIRSFGGLDPTADPHDLPPGTAVAMLNMVSQRRGELRVRGGFRVLTFDE